MSACPECGDRVPFGGGQTVKNAHSMFELVRLLTDQLKPADGGAEARQFVERGRSLAASLHDYGHKRSMINPDWQAAGLWNRQATAVAQDLSVR
jgi:hypothetical protein